jgi:5,6-dimethylbenzimidazole synthase
MEMALNIDELLELMRKRRSIRRFKSDSVPDQYINKILEAGRWAQSGSNAQPWEYIVVKNQDTKNKLAEKWVPTRLHTYNIEQIRRPDMIHHALSKPQGTPPGSWKDAPVLIVVCGDRRTLMTSVLYMNFITTEGGPSSVFIKNMSNTVHNMHLAAAALGLGSQWLSVDYVFEQDVRAILGIPAVLEIHSIIAIGYPDIKMGPGYRRDLSEIVHYEKYNMSKHRTDNEVIDFILRLKEMKM